jgi:hypothetical protein
MICDLTTINCDFIHTRIIYIGDSRLHAITINNKSYQYSSIGTGYQCRVVINKPANMVVVIPLINAVTASLRITSMVVVIPVISDEVAICSLLTRYLWHLQRELVIMARVLQALVP